MDEPNKIPDRFTWQPAQRQYGESPYADAGELHLSPSYGPHICPRCHGAGWMVNRHVPVEDPAFGQLVKCEACADITNQADNRRLQELWKLSGLNPAAKEPATFDGLDVGDAATREQIRATRAFAGTPRGWLTLYGSNGGGKSHLGEAITRYLLNLRIPVLFIRSPDLFVYLGATERISGAEVNYELRMYFVQNTRVLIVDEFGKEPNTETVWKLRTSLLDFRYAKARADEGGATVLLSNWKPEDWTDPAIASRARDGRFVCLQSTAIDYRRLKK